jgi:hypothetical protein
VLLTVCIHCGEQFEPIIGVPHVCKRQYWPAGVADLDGPLPIMKLEDDSTNPKQKYGDKKVPLAFVPPASIIYEALAFKEGARKYGAYNWREKKVELMTYLHAALRHLYAMLDGEELDPESGLHHIGHVKACMGILADARETGNLIDNRPPRGTAGDILRREAK